MVRNFRKLESVYKLDLLALTMDSQVVCREELEAVEDSSIEDPISLKLNTLLNLEVLTASLEKSFSTRGMKILKLTDTPEIILMQS